MSCLGFRGVALSGVGTTTGSDQAIATGSVTVVMNWAVAVLLLTTPVKVIRAKMSLVTLAARPEVTLEAPLAAPLDPRKYRYPRELPKRNAQSPSVKSKPSSRLWNRPPSPLTPQLFPGKKSLLPLYRLSPRNQRGLLFLQRAAPANPRTKTTSPW